MLECGPSVLAGLKRGSIDTTRPDAILVSHLHGDHFGGIPFLLLEYKFKNPRTRPLVIAGPATIEARVAALYGALYQDIRRHECAFPVTFVVAEPGKRFDLAGFSIEPFQVPHTALPYCLGYRIEGGGGRMLFSGDSAWTEDFVRQSQNTDLFLCECCSVEPDAPVHTCYRDIVAHRAKLGCRRLLLTHLGADVRASAEVDVELARDGLVVDIVK